jgi:hypothetical protein
MRSDSFHRQSAQCYAGISCKPGLHKCDFPPAYRNSTVVLGLLELTPKYIKEIHAQSSFGAPALSQNPRCVVPVVPHIIRQVYGNHLSYWNPSSLLCVFLAFRPFRDALRHLISLGWLERCIFELDKRDFL